MSKFHFNNRLKAFIIAFAIYVLLPLVYKNVALKQFNNYINSLKHTDITFMYSDLQWFRNFPHFTFVLKDLNICSHDNSHDQSSFVFSEVRLSLDFWDMIKGQGTVKNIYVNGADIHLYKQNGSFGFNELTMTESSRNKKLSIHKIILKNANITFADTDNNLKYELHNLSATLRSTEKAENKSYTIKNEKGEFSLSRNGLYYLKQTAFTSDIVFFYDKAAAQYIIEQSGITFNDMQSFFEGGFSLKDDKSFIVIDGKSRGQLREMLSVWGFFYENDFENLTTNGTYDIRYFYEYTWGNFYTEQYDFNLISKNGSIKYNHQKKGIDSIDIILSASKKIDNDVLFMTDISLVTEKSNLKAQLYHGKESNKNLVFSNKMAVFLNFSEWDEIFASRFAGDLHTLNIDMNFEGVYNPNNTDKSDLTSSGHIALNGFTYQASPNASPIHIDTAHIVLKNNSFYMTEFYSCIGNSAFEAKGEWHNIMGFIAGTENLEGQWHIKSKLFNWHVFFEDTNNATSFSHFHIPENIILNLFIDIDTLHVNGVNFEKFQTHTTFDKGTMIIRESTANLNNGRSTLKGIYINKRDTEAAYYFSLIYKNMEAHDILRLIDFTDSNAFYITGVVDAQLDINSNNGYGAFLKYAALESAPSIFYDNLLQKAESEKVAFFSLSASELKGYNIEFFKFLSEELKIPVIDKGKFEDICIKMHISNVENAIECFEFSIEDIHFVTHIEWDDDNNHSLSIDITIPLIYFNEKQAYDRLKTISEQSGANIVQLLKKEHITFRVFPNEKLYESGIIVKQ